MSDELRFVNAFIGFCTPMGGTWPNPLLNLSYQVVGVEREIYTTLSGTPRKVVPELICASATQNHVFCLEAKSATLSIDQARKYLAITSSELGIAGILLPGMSTSALTHDVIYVALPANAPTLAAEMAKKMTNLPIIAGDPTRFSLYAGTIAQATIQEEFTAGVAIAPQHVWPTHFVQFNRHASTAQLSAPVIASLSRFLLRADRFTTQDVAERAVPHWQFCGTEERNAFLNKMHDLINQAQREELKPYFKPVSPPKKVKPERNRPWEPVGKKPMSPATLTSFQRAASSFVNRQQRGIPFKKQQPPLPGL